MSELNSNVDKHEVKRLKMPMPNDVTLAINNLIDAVNSQKSQKVHVHLATVSVIAASFIARLDGVESLSEIEEFLVSDVAKQALTYLKSFSRAEDKKEPTCEE